MRASTSRRCARRLPEQIPGRRRPGRRSPRFSKRAPKRGAQGLPDARPAGGEGLHSQLACRGESKSVVKSKSMASEEIHLNRLPPGDRHLVGHARPTWASGSSNSPARRPSHMVMPAIHMTKEEVTELFQKEVDERLTSDIPRLVKVARGNCAASSWKPTWALPAPTSRWPKPAPRTGHQRRQRTPGLHAARRSTSPSSAWKNWWSSSQPCRPSWRPCPEAPPHSLLTSYVTIISGPTPNDDGTTKELHIILMDNSGPRWRATPSSSRRCSASAAAPA